MPLRHARCPARRAMAPIDMVMPRAQGCMNAFHGGLRKCRLRAKRSRLVRHPERSLRQAAKSENLIQKPLRLPERLSERLWPLQLSQQPEFRARLSHRGHALRRILRRGSCPPERSEGATANNGMPSNGPGRRPPLRALAYRQVAHKPPEKAGMYYPSAAGSGRSRRYLNS